MEIALKRLLQFLSGDQAPRLLLLGGSVVLALVVIIDLFGARGRADAVRDTMRMVREAEDSSVSVPSIARVPRDLASEARLAALQAQTLAMAEAPETESDAHDAEPAEDLTEDATEMDVAEAEGGDEAPEEMAAEDTAADATEIETAGSDAGDDAPAAEDATAEDVTDIAEAEAVEEAAEVAEDAVEAEVAASDDGSLALLASADLANGQRVWRQCAACHVHETEQNRGGPHLVNIVGRDIGAAEGWRYSRALSERGGVWSVESLLAWIENPDAYIPGNQMAFRGLRDEQDRIDVLGFLNNSRSD